jgi:hypothetical protein
MPDWDKILNGIGLAGLGSALTFIIQRGLEIWRAHHEAHEKAEARKRIRLRSLRDAYAKWASLLEQNCADRLSQNGAALQLMSFRASLGQLSSIQPERAAALKAEREEIEADLAAHEQTIRLSARKLRMAKAILILLETDRHRQESISGLSNGFNLSMPSKEAQRVVELAVDHHNRVVGEATRARDRLTDFLASISKDLQ